MDIKKVIHGITVIYSSFFETYFVLLPSGNGLCAPERCGTMEEVENIIDTHKKQFWWENQD